MYDRTCDLATLFQSTFSIQYSHGYIDVSCVKLFMLYVCYVRSICMSVLHRRRLSVVGEWEQTHLVVQLGNKLIVCMCYA